MRGFDEKIFVFPHLNDMGTYLQQLQGIIHHGVHVHDILNENGRKLAFKLENCVCVCVCVCGGGGGGSRVSPCHPNIFDWVHSALTVMHVCFIQSDYSLQ